MTRLQKLGMQSCALLASSLLAGAALAEGGEKVRSLDECVEYALSHNVDLKDSEADLNEAKAAQSGTRGAFAPKLHVDGNLFEWNSAYGLPFGTQMFWLHKQATGMLSISVIEPLTPLFAIYDQYKVGTLGIDVATIRRDATRRDVAFRTAEAYMELLKVERLQNVEEASVHELEKNLQQAQSLFDHGVIGKNDLLRADLALAEAKQRLITARGQVVLQKGVLATAMGMGAGGSVEVAPWSAEPHPLEADSVETLEQRAATNRVEIAALNRAVEQSEKGVAIAKLKYMPTVNLVGNYTHVGGSPLQQLDAEYVGIQGSWDVLDWGTTAAGVTQAKAQADRAKTAKTRLEDNLRLEARRAFVNAKSTSEALGVARVAVAQAEENFRIVSKRFEAATSTSFDVVDAEALLTRARAREQTALFDYLIARYAVQRATGSMRPKTE